MLESLFTSQLLVPTVLALVTWLGHTIWNRLSAKEQAAITSGLGAVKSVLSNIALSAPKGMSPANLQNVLVGAANSELKSLGVDATNPAVAALVSTAVSDAMGLWLSTTTQADVHASVVALPPTATLTK